MDDVRREDARLWGLEWVQPLRILATMGALAALFALSSGKPAVFWAGAPLVLAASGLYAWRESKARRFRDQRVRDLWRGCEDRLARFEEALRKGKGSRVADLEEMPTTIRGVAASLYVALRRADLIADELRRSEQGLSHPVPVFRSGDDPQSDALYAAADRSRAEYRQSLRAVLAGVQRAEAQAALFISAVDSLRMKMMSHRLTGRSPELGSHDFLEALAEAKAQLHSIDTALEELDLGAYPKTIAVPAQDVEPLEGEARH